MSKAIQVKNIKQYEDGSSWSATVYVEGVLYVASYVANKLVVALGPYKHNPRRASWHLVYVQTWAKLQVSNFNPEWLALHTEMYKGI